MSVIKFEEKDELVKKFHQFEKLKHSTVNPKVFIEKSLCMLETVIKSKAATQTTLQIIETFAKIKELSRNINKIMKIYTTTMSKQLELNLEKYNSQYPKIKIENLNFFIIYF